ncbi:MAG: CCA tRNA nucleotidyltransferase [Syntrophales bacterium]|nr:CCA tRNA nucleotidyltransferase [Syntrophales bacterium]
MEARKKKLKLNKFHSPSLEKATYIVQRLRSAGYEASFVGGCVRDFVMGVIPEDYDIVTSAKPEKIQKIFNHTVAVGAAFGVVVVIIDDKKFEVATYREEKEYKNGRHPSKVNFADVMEDVKRRDFTINGLLMDPVTGEITDLVGGMEDIEKRLIRTIGKPEERFQEDHLRMLRAIRFAAQLNFTIEESTLLAINSLAYMINRISAERIREELTKIVSQKGADKGLELLFSTGLLEEILPEVAALRGVEQPPTYHPEGDVWTHTLRIFEILPDIKGTSWEPVLAWAALLHDTGKRVTKTEDENGIHFYGHVKASENIAASIMKRLRFSNTDTEKVISLIHNHMRFLHVREMKLSTLKRFLRMPDFSLHLTLHLLDCLASHGILENYDYCRRKLEELPPEKLKPNPLLTGHDLIALGFTPGPLFGKILKEVEDAQLNGQIVTKEEAKEYVLKNWGSTVGFNDKK